jgi:SAM-dependent methyltransferase
VQGVIAQACKEHAEIEFLHLPQTTPLPFSEGSFDSVTLLDVLEHVAPQRSLLQELRRVLKDDGVLVVTVPGSHLFSFLDLGNLKFRFPRLHRWWYVRRHSRTEYERRYVSNPNGLIGDVSAEKRWHEHFSRRRLRAMLEEAGFVVQDFDGAGFFNRALWWLQLSVGRVPVIRRVLVRMANADMRRFESAHLFCVARKRDDAPGSKEPGAS